MRKIGSKIVLSAIIGVMMGSATLLGNTLGKGKLKLVQEAMQSRTLIAKVAKDYLYIGNDIATTKAQREMQESLKKFDKDLADLSRSVNDPKLKNLLTFIKMNRSDMSDILKEPYSLDNAQEIIDLGDSIAEAEMGFVKKLVKGSKFNVEDFGEQNYLINQIAKYYMSYKAGIKDINTVHKMDNAVKELQGLIDKMKKNPLNTPQMNHLVNKISRDWKVVHQFYLDIKSGDLPFIVYETSDKLDQEFSKYNKLKFKELEKNGK